MATLLAKNIILQYFIWHYFDVPKKILVAWKNILVFNLEFFSIFELLKTLFSHWRRYIFSYPKYFDIAEYSDIFFSNLVSRCLGAVVRIFLIIIGLLIEIIIFFLGAIIFLGWLILPFVLALTFYLGIRLI